MPSVAGSASPSADDAQDPSVIEREGARVLLFDGDDRLLLLRGHDPHVVSRSWWFTPGGGVEAGESHRAAASRELLEETGFAVAEEALVGPVWERIAVFDFMSRPYVQHELFYVARLADAVDTGLRSWTVAERDTVDEVAWVTHHELRHAGIEVFPVELTEVWHGLHHWDGQLRHLGRAEE